MDLNKGRKIVMQMEECFEKLKLPIFSETENINGNQNDRRIEFFTFIKLEDIGNTKLQARLFHNLNLIELSIYLILDYDNFKRHEIIHLLNQINFWRTEAHWSLCDCCNEIELRYATTINKSLPKKYFKQMIKKTIYLGKSFYPLILKQIKSDENPYEVAYEYYLNNSELIIANLSVSFDDICENLN